MADRTYFIVMLQQQVRPAQEPAAPAAPPAAPVPLASVWWVPLAVAVLTGFALMLTAAVSAIVPRFLPLAPTAPTILTTKPTSESSAAASSPAPQKCSE